MLACGCARCGAVQCSAVQWGSEEGEGLILAQQRRLFGHGETCLLSPVSLPNVELQRVGGGSGASGRPHAACLRTQTATHTVYACSSEEEDAASQLQSLESIYP